MVVAEQLGRPEVNFSSLMVVCRHKLNEILEKYSIGRESCLHNPMLNTAGMLANQYLQCCCNYYYYVNNLCAQPQPINQRVLVTIVKVIRTSSLSLSF